MSEFDTLALEDATAPHALQNAPTLSHDDISSNALRNLDRVRRMTVGVQDEDIDTEKAQFHDPVFTRESKQTTLRQEMYAGGDAFLQDDTLHKEHFIHQHDPYAAEHNPPGYKLTHSNNFLGEKNKPAASFQTSRAREPFQTLADTSRAVQEPLRPPEHANAPPRTTNINSNLPSTTDQGRPAQKSQKPMASKMALPPPPNMAARTMQNNPRYDDFTAITDRYALPREPNLAYPYGLYPPPTMPYYPPYMNLMTYPPELLHYAAHDPRMHGNLPNAPSSPIAHNSSQNGNEPAAPQNQQQNQQSVQQQQAGSSQQQHYQQPMQPQPQQSPQYQQPVQQQQQLQQSPQYQQPVQQPVQQQQQQAAPQYPQPVQQQSQQAPQYQQPMQQQQTAPQQQPQQAPVSQQQSQQAPIAQHQQQTQQASSSQQTTTDTQTTTVTTNTTGDVAQTKQEVKLLKPSTWDKKTKIGVGIAGLLLLVAIGVTVFLILRAHSKKNPKGAKKSLFGKKNNAEPTEKAQASSDETQAQEDEASEKRPKSENPFLST